MNSSLLSTLAGKYRADAPRFIEEHRRHDWLVWEPGRWAVSSFDENTRASLGGQSAPPAGDAPAFPLDREKISLGRGRCDVLISDATLSKLHLTLSRDRSGWLVKDEGSRNGTWVAGIKVLPSAPRAVLPG